MITASLILVGKIFLMILIIGAMVAIIVGLGQLFHVDDLNSLEDDLRLKDEVKNEENVVGEKNVFCNFLMKAEEKNHSSAHIKESKTQKPEETEAASNKNY